MSYTNPIIPISHEETDRRLENVVNRLKRHCKIGKVTHKSSPNPYAFTPKPIQKREHDIWKMWPFNGDARAPMPQYMDKCGCKVGTACNSVSCPHGPVLTC